MKRKKIIMGIMVVAIIGAFIFSGIYLKDSYALGEEGIATAIEPEMKVEKFAIKNQKIKYGDKVYLEIKYTYPTKVSSCSIWLKGKDYENHLYYAIQDLNKEPYFMMSDNSAGTVFPGEYQVDAMTCFPQSSSIQYLIENNSSLTYSNNIFTNESGNIIVEEETNKIHTDLNQIHFELIDKVASNGDKVKTNFYTNLDTNSVLLSFYNTTTNETLAVYLKGMEQKHFTIPSTAVSGEYQLQYILIKSSKNNTYTIMNDNGETKLYQNGLLTYSTLKVDFNQILKIENNEGDNNNTLENTSTYFFNNENYNEQIQSQINTLDKNAVITVVADNYTVIHQNLFQALQGTKRTLIIEYGESEWIFNGADITNPKNIDVSMMIKDITNKDFKNSSLISDFPAKTKLLTFSNNGTLPGKVLIRLKSMELDKLFEEDNLYIYYYDLDEDKFLKVAMEVQKENGYYEFYINHNSKYILTEKELKNQYIAKSDEILSLNQDETKQEKKKNINFYFLITGIILVLGIVIMIIIKGKKKF